MQPVASSLRVRARAEAKGAVLEALRAHRQLSRAQLTGLLRLPKSTASGLVADLVAEGLVVEIPGRPGGSGSGSGRPASVLALAGVDGLVAGIDFGHRHVRVALADGECRVLGEDVTELDVDRHAADALDAADALLRGLLDRNGAALADVRATTAGIPGPIDAATRTVQSPTILAGWVGLDLRAELRSRTGLDVAVDNDANLGALGELTWGTARGYHDFVYVKASNGIGACLMLGGAAYRGAGGVAGEIGHTQLDPNGEWCRCGNRGCLEAVVSIDTVRRQLAPLGIDPLDTDEVVHPVARRVLAESGRTVGRVLANLCNALDPQAVILGGDLSATGDAFVGGVRESIERLAQPSARGVAEVRPARLGRRAELLGAVTAAAAAAVSGR